MGAMSSIYQLVEKDRILKLLKKPVSDKNLFSMPVWQLRGMSFGIGKLEDVLKLDSKLILKLSDLNLRVKAAEHMGTMMNRLDELLSRYNSLNNKKHL